MLHPISHKGIIILSIFALCAHLLSHSPAHAVDMVKVATPAQFCDEGLFLTGENERFSYEDMVLEANSFVALNEKGKVTAYGYVGFVNLPTEISGRTEAYLFAGENCSFSEVSPNTSLMVGLIFEPSITKFSTEKYREIRKIMFSSSNLAHGTALLKFTGSFSLFTDTGGLYFLADDVELIDLPSMD